MTPATAPLDLDLSQALQQARKICTVEIVGVVELADVARAVSAQQRTGQDVEAVTPRPEEDPTSLKKLREKHHSVARLIASGMKQGVVASLAGYSESYVSVLLDNPAMKELIALYRGNYTAGSEVVRERLQTVAGEASLQLQEKLDAAASGGEPLTASELVAIAKLGLDRSGHGPSSHVAIQAETHIFDHAELRRRDRAARADSESHFIEPPQLPPPAPSDAEPSLEPAP